MSTRPHRVEVGPKFSEGARQLWLALVERNWTQEEARVELGLARGMLSRWLYGERCPGGPMRVRLVERLAIPVGAWDVAPKGGAVLPPAVMRSRKAAA